MSFLSRGVIDSFTTPPPSSAPSLHQGKSTIAFLLANTIATIAPFAGQPVGKAALALSRAVAMGTQRSLLQRRDEHQVIGEEDEFDNGKKCLGVSSEIPTQCVQAFVSSFFLFLGVRYLQTTRTLTSLPGAY